MKIKKSYKFLALILCAVLCLPFFFQTTLVARAEEAYKKTNITVSNSDFEKDKYNGSPIKNITDWTAPKSDSEVAHSVIQDGTNNVLSITTDKADKYFAMRSKSITFDRYSYYIISVRAKVTSGTVGGLKLGGLSDSLVKTEITTTDWTTHKIFLSTGNTKTGYYIYLSLGASEDAKSTGSAFFDDVKIDQVSEATYKNEVGSNPKYEGNTSATYENFDGDSILSNIDLGDAEIVDLSAAENKVYDDQTYNNKKAVVLTGNSAGKEIKIKDLALEHFKIYAFSVNIKLLEELTDKKLTIELKEQSGKISTPYYSPFTSTITTKKASKSETLNGFVTYTFFVKTDIFYDTVADLTIKIAEDKKIAVDSIKMDMIDEDDFVSATATTSSSDFDNVRKTTIKSKSTGLGVSNGYFLDVDYAEPNMGGLYMPNYWNFSPSSPEHSGVKIDFGNKTSELIVYAADDGNQTLTSNGFTLSANTYYEIYFKINTTNLQDGTILTANFSTTASLGNNESKKIVFQTFNINKSTEWQEFRFYIATDTNSVYMKAEFAINNKGITSPASFVLQKVTASKTSVYNIPAGSKIYDLGIQTEIDDGFVKYDEYKEFELVENIQDGKGDLMTFDTDSNVDDSNHFAGAIEVNSANGFNPSEFDAKYLLYIKNDTAATTSLKQIYDTTLGKNSFYKLSIKVNADIDVTDELVVYFDNLNQRININRNTGFEEFTVYVATGKKTVDIKLNVLLRSKKSSGSSVLADAYVIEQISELDFEDALSSESLLIEDKRSETTDDEDKDDKDDETTEESSPITNEIWFWIPTALLGLCVIGVLIVVLLRKFKIKRKVKISNKYNSKTQRISTQAKREASDIQTKLTKELNSKIEKTTLQLNATKKQLENLNNSNVSSVSGAKAKTQKQESLIKKQAKLKAELDKLNNKLSQIQAKEFASKQKNELRLKKQKKQSKTKLTNI